MYKLLLIFLFSSTGWLSCNKEDEFAQPSNDIHNTQWRRIGGPDYGLGKAQTLFFGDSQVTEYRINYVGSVNYDMKYCYQKQTYGFSVVKDKLIVSGGMVYRYTRNDNVLKLYDGSGDYLEYIQVHDLDELSFNLCK